MAEGAEGVATEIIGRLERAWNAGDGRAFGEPFAPDADFVDRITLQRLFQFSLTQANQDNRAFLVLQPLS